MDVKNTYFESNDAVFDHIKFEVLDALEKNLSPYLTYHSVQHTRDVLKDAVQIANQEDMSPTALMKIKIAALFHDTGFMVTYQNHEEASCDYARKILSKYKIANVEILDICEIIMATKIPQNPMDQCGKILADADLAYLGTAHFSHISDLLFDELKHINPKLDLQKWNEIQINFLHQHQYFTQYCIIHKTPIKNAHLQQLISCQ